MYFDILFFAFLAAFVIIRLVRVLGHKPDDSRDDTKFSRDDTKFLNSDEPEEGEIFSISASLGKADNDASSPENSKVGMDPPGLKDIQRHLPGFSVQEFLAGARGAYEIVIMAFANGEKDELARLLTKGVYENFSNAIDERTKRGESLETTLVGIDKAEVIEARLSGQTSEITVKFVTQIINVIRKSDEIEQSEDQGEARQVVDIWTFVRDIGSKDPNWSLAETRSTT